MALTSAPYYLSKLPVGFFSGYLLEAFCPDPEVCNNCVDISCDAYSMLCEKTCGICDNCEDVLCSCRAGYLWTSVGLITIVSPILMILFKSKLYKSD